MLDATHDPALRSWVRSANPGEPGADADFPIQNLPFGVFAPAGAAAAGPPDWRVGVAIGSSVLDLRAAVRGGVFAGASWSALCAGELNEFLALGAPSWSAVRAALSQALRAGDRRQRALESCLFDQSEVRHRVPVRVGDYSDFYTSIHHARRVGELLRPDNPLLPNYRWIPIGYHGRSSSIIVSGTAFRRPFGQILPEGGVQPALAPTRRLDYELELAACVGTGNELGHPIPISAAEQRVFGFFLLNDWSARDIQAWEYQPLGPFLGKSFATSVSPWLVTLEALAPFRAAWLRPPQDPAPLAYLDDPAVRAWGAFDIQMSVGLRTPAMRARGDAAFRLSTSNYRDAYWCLAQMVAHHSAAGCNLRTGDLLATGTQSGPARDQAGCLLELTHGGRQAIRLPDGEERTFLEDGDEITLTAECARPGAARIGFGRCVGLVLPAPV